MKMRARAGLIALAAALPAHLALAHGDVAPQPVDTDSLPDIGEEWLEGEEMISEGKDLIEDGEDDVDDGEALISKGKKKIRKGEAMIRDGERMMKEAERAYRERGLAAPTS